jgi:hypothetical protein
MNVLDHLILLCEKGAPEADSLVHLGLTEGPSNTHPGQGTANRRFFFQNAYLELLWVNDEIEARSEMVRPTQLWDRWMGRRTDACPFGVVLRPGSAESAPPPFSLRAYRPAYLPAGMTIDVADGVPLTEPAIFCLGFAGSRGTTQGAAHSHRPGLERITGVTIDTPVSGSRSEAMQWLEASGVLSLRPADRWLMTVAFDNQRAGASADLRPALPLLLEW